MIQDLSKQDIAAQPEEFSVEDIIREFSERMPAPKEEPKKVAAEVPFDSVSGGIRGQQTVPQEGTEPLSEAAEAPEKPASFEEPVLQNAQAEARQSPAPAPMSQSEIASAIAQVVESAFAAPAPANEPQEMQAVSHTVEQDRESKQTREQKRQQGHAPSPEQAAERKVLETVQTDLEQAAPQEPVTQPVTSEEDKEVLKKKNDVPESQDQSSQKEEQQPRETVEKPNTRHVKIPRSRRTPGALEYIGTMILDIRRRQMAALPASGVSLRGREKQMLVTARIERIFSYFRYGILLLMCMCLAGRRFQWMSLGFMQGLGGTYTALVLTVLCFFFSWQSTIRAVRDLWYFRFSFESLLLIATVVSMLEALSSKN